MLDEKVADILRSFEVDPDTGFVLPDPLIRLPAAFEPWHQIIDEMPELIEKNLLDDRIKQLPVIGTDTLKSNRELRLAHLLLVTLAAGHARLSIPANIALPLLDVSNRLGLKPIACHASVCLANWKPLQIMVPFDATLTDIIAFRFIRHNGNGWFFTLTAQIETELAGAIRAIADACFRHQIHESTMLQIKDAVTEATNSIQRMSEHLPPDVFYYGFRHFLSGYTQKALAKQGGVIFEGREDLGPQPLAGGSAAQSSSFHVIDEFLGIEHSGNVQEYLTSQRLYMPPKHRDFINWIQQNAAEIPHLKQSVGYKEAVRAVKKFRETHLEVVTNFIGSPHGNSTEQGTGGSLFMKLLINAINDSDI